jgi:hypothetical protein
MSHLLYCFFALFINNTRAMDLIDYLALPANPMKIAVTLDNETVSKKIIAKTGGVLTLAAANGDLFELTIPANSLPRDMEIKLQKVKNIKHPNLSSTANYSSVEISPDGTELKAPAILVLKPKHAFPISTLTPFQAQADGNETQLAMLIGKPNPNEIKLGLLHFSNYTISDEPSVDEIIDHGLSQNESIRISSWLNKKLLEKQKTGGDISKELDSAFKESFNKVILPSIMSVNTCASGRIAINNYLGWNRQLALVGADPATYFPPGFDIDLFSMFKDVSEQCFELAKMACYEQHSPVEVWQYSLGIMRQAQLLGAPDIAEKFQDLATKCSKFRFFMESEIWIGESRQESSGVTAKADFNFIATPFDTEPVEGSIDVESTSLDMSEVNCTQTSFETRPSKVLIKDFLSLKNQDAKTFTVNIGGLTPYSLAKYRCVDKTDPKIVMEMSVPGGPMGSYWGGVFMGAHGPTGLNEFDMTTGFYTMKGWEVRHDTRYAAKNYSQIVQEVINETTDIVIYHTPDSL